MEAEATKKLMCPACNARFDGGTFCSKDGTPLVEDTSIGKSKNRVGQVLADRYKLVRLLGEGGMGQVYEAQHVNINKRFAIKMLRPEIVSNPEATQRFRQEAWSASSIGHENIIGIDDFATLPDGSVYLAMEFLDGQSLAERLKNGPPLDLGQALSAFMQICRGLGAAHEKGIIHRDMKPENVFVGERYGRMTVKILDFGIAKVSGADGTSQLTRTGQIFGTPHYMSPEQALGKPLDNRSDIYATGVMLYETFTGRIPFEAESFMGILTKHIMTPPTPPTELAPDVPPQIEEIILKAMAKEPENRYQDMAAFHDALWAAASELAPEVVSGTPSQPMRMPSQPALPASGGSGLHKATPSGGMSRGGPAAAPGRVSRVMAPVPVPAAHGGPASAQVKRISASAQAATLSGEEAAAMPFSTTAGVMPIATTGSGATTAQPVSGSYPQAAQPVSGPYPQAAQPVSGSYPQAQPGRTTNTDLEVPRRSKAPIVIAGVLAVAALGGGGAWYWQSQRQVSAAPAPSAPSAPAPAPVAPTPPAPVGRGEAVLIESIPTRAKVIQNGKEIAETPHPFVLEPGEKVTVTLTKEGYLSTPIDLDLAKGKKILIKLEKDKSAEPKVAAKPEPKPEAKPAPPPPVAANEPKGKLGKLRPGLAQRLPRLQTPTPQPTPPPTTTPTPTPTPAPVKKTRPKDPYERLDEKKGSEILNPY